MTGGNPGMTKKRGRNDKRGTAGREKKKKLKPKSSFFPAIPFLFYFIDHAVSFIFHILDHPTCLALNLFSERGAFAGGVGCRCLPIRSLPSLAFQFFFLSRQCLACWAICACCSSKRAWSAANCAARVVGERGRAGAAGISSRSAPAA